MYFLQEFAAEGHLRWDNIRNYIYFASAFASNNLNFDIFSGINQEGIIILFIIVFSYY